MTAGSLAGLLRPPERRATIRVLIVALLTAAICWYFGTDVWHAIVLGCVITTLGVIGRVGAALEVGGTTWRDDGASNRRGSRNEIAELAWSLRGGFGRVGHRSMWRVQQLARRRLALHHLDLLNPADRLQIEQLLGRRVYSVLAHSDRRPPPLRSVLRCLDALDALDALDPMRPAAPLPGPRRRTPASLRRRPRRIRER